MSKQLRASLFFALLVVSSHHQPLTAEEDPGTRAERGSVLVGFDNRASFAAAAASPLTLVDFEPFADGMGISTQLSIFGIDEVSGDQIAGANPGPVNIFVTASGNLPFALFAPGTLPSESKFLSIDLSAPGFATGRITFELEVPMTAIGAYIADQFPIGDFRIEVFDGATSIGAITVGPRSLPDSFVGVVSGIPFTRATFSPVNASDSWGVDNLELAHPQPLQVVAAGYEIFNYVSMPSQVPSNWGDLMFSDDGTIAYFIGESESLASGVWIATVERDANGNVTGFGSITSLFSDLSIDTGLELYPGSTTLFFRGDSGTSESLAQRQADGTTEYKDILNYDGTFGGMAFVPADYGNAGGLLSTSYHEESIFYHSVSDDGDGTYTVGNGALFCAVFRSVGDLEYIRTGGLADTLLFADYSGDSVAYIDIDPVTGLPVGSFLPEVKDFLTGLDHAWGLAVDPVTNNIFVVSFDESLIVQIVSTGIFSDGFESGGLSSWSASP